MESLQKLIRSKLTQRQLSYLRNTIMSNYMMYSLPSGYNIFCDTDILETLLIPLWYENKDKTLKIKPIANYTITGVNANTTIQGLIDAYFGNRNADILLLSVKRGNTFIDAYMKANENWKYLDRISLYLQLSAHHKVKVFQNGGKILIYTNTESNEFFKRVISALPLMLKDIFTLSEDTIKFYRSMQEDLSGKETSELLIQYLKQTKLLEEQRLNELTTAIKNISEYEYKHILMEEERIKNSIKNYEKDISKLYKDLRETQLKATFFKPDLNAKELANYILANPNIVDFTTTDQAILLAIEAPLEYIDIPALRKILQNASSFVWPRWNNVPKPIAQHSEEFIQMLSDLFLKEKYTLYTRSEIVLDLSRKIAYPFSRVSQNTTAAEPIKRAYPKEWNLETRLKEEKTITPHMHIEFYDCWGGNKSNIEKCLNAGDIIGALDIAVNTTKDINVTDSTVFNRFLQDGLWAPTTPKTSYYAYNTRPDLQFKTIYDNEQKRFRTFGDIFYNEYVKENITQFDINENFDDII